VRAGRDGGTEASRATETCEAWRRTKDGGSQKVRWTRMSKIKRGERIIHRIGPAKQPCCMQLVCQLVVNVKTRRHTVVLLTQGGAGAAERG